MTTSRTEPSSSANSTSARRLVRGRQVNHSTSPRSISAVAPAEENPRSRTAERLRRVADPTGDSRLPRSGSRARSGTGTRTRTGSGSHPGFRTRTAVSRLGEHWYPILLAVLALGTACAYLINLSANGWANSFYAAAVQAGSQNWEAFLFGSSDAANAITVDKPPASLWLMELSVRLFGLGTVQMLAPQVLLAALTVVLLARSVRLALRERTGDRTARWAALAAGLFFALSPVAALMFRFNNPDALLVTLMTAAVVCTQQAVANSGVHPRFGRTRTRRLLASPRFWLVCAGAAIGLGFLTKQLQVLLIAPGLVAGWLIAARQSWPRRLLALLWPLASMVVSCGWWVALVELMPADMRPYVGGSQTNSFLELTFGYNGLGRLTGDETGSVIGGGATGGGNAAGAWGETGIGRLLTGEYATQIAWLLPAALLLLLLLAVEAVQNRATRSRNARPFSAAAAAHAEAPRAAASPGSASSPKDGLAGTSAVGTPNAQSRDLNAALAAWSGWLVVTWLTLSFMSGIVHSYYTVALVPAIAASIAICIPVLLAKRRIWTLPALAGVVALTAAWQFVLLADVSGMPGWLRWIVLGSGSAAALLIICGSMLRQTTPRRAIAVLALGLSLLTGIAAPAALTVNTIGSAAHGSIVSVAGTGMGHGGPGGQGAPGAGAPGGQNGQPGTAPGAGQGAGGKNSTRTRQNPNGMREVGGASPGGVSNGQQAQARANQSDASGLGGTGGLLGGAEPGAELTAYLSSDSSNYTWAAATTGASSAARYQLATGDPVMAIGGFNGTDPAPSLAQFQQYVADGKIHFYVAGDTARAGTGAAAQISSWVEENFTSTTVDGTVVYDLSTGAGS